MLPSLLSAPRLPAATRAGGLLLRCFATSPAQVEPPPPLGTSVGGDTVALLDTLGKDTTKARAEHRLLTLALSRIGGAAAPSAEHAGSPASPGLGVGKEESQVALVPSPRPQRRPFSALLGESTPPLERRRLAEHLATAGLFNNRRGNVWRRVQEDFRGTPGSEVRSTTPTPGLAGELLGLRVAFAAMYNSELIEEKRLALTLAPGKSGISEGVVESGAWAEEVLGACGLPGKEVEALRVEAHTASRLLSLLGVTSLPKGMGGFMEAAKPLTQQLLASTASSSSSSLSTAAATAALSEGYTAEGVDKKGGAVLSPFLFAYLGHATLAAQAIQRASDVSSKEAALLSAHLLTTVRRAPNKRIHSPLLESLKSVVKAAGPRRRGPKSKREGGGGGSSSSDESGGGGGGGALALLTPNTLPSIYHPFSWLSLPGLLDSSSSSSSRGVGGQGGKGGGLVPPGMLAAIYKAWGSTPPPSVLACASFSTAVRHAIEACSTTTTTTATSVSGGAASTTVGLSKQGGVKGGSATASAASGVKPSTKVAVGSGVAKPPGGGIPPKVEVLLTSLAPHIKGRETALRTTVSALETVIGDAVARGSSRESTLAVVASPEGQGRPAFMAFLSTLPPLVRTAFYLTLMRGLPYVKVRHVDAFFARTLPSSLGAVGGGLSLALPSLTLLPPSQATPSGSKHTPMKTMPKLQPPSADWAGLTASVAASQGGGGGAPQGATKKGGASAASLASFSAAAVAAIAAEVQTTGFRFPYHLRASSLPSNLERQRLDLELEGIVAGLASLCPLPPATQAILDAMHPDPRAHALGFAARLVHLLPTPTLIKLSKTVGDMSAMVARAHARAAEKHGGGGAASSSSSTSRFVSHWPPKGLATPTPFPAGPRPAALMRGGRWAVHTLRVTHLTRPLGHIVDDPLIYLAARGWMTPGLIELASGVLKHSRSVKLVGNRGAFSEGLGGVTVAGVPLEEGSGGSGEMLAPFQFLDASSPLPNSTALVPLSSFLAPSLNRGGKDYDTLDTSSSVSDLLIPVSKEWLNSLAIPTPVSFEGGTPPPSTAPPPTSMLAVAPPSSESEDKAPPTLLVTPSPARFFPRRIHLSSSQGATPRMSKEEVARTLLVLGLPIISKGSFSSSSSSSSSSGAALGGGGEGGRAGQKQAMNATTVKALFASWGRVEGVRLLHDRAEAYTKEFWGENYGVYQRWMQAHTGKAAMLSGRGGGGASGGVRAFSSAAAAAAAEGGSGSGEIPPLSSPKAGAKNPGKKVKQQGKHSKSSLPPSSLALELEKKGRRGQRGGAKGSGGVSQGLVVEASSAKGTSLGDIVPSIPPSSFQSLDDDEEEEEEEGRGEGGGGDTLLLDRFGVGGGVGMGMVNERRRKSGSGGAGSDTSTSSPTSPPSSSSSSSSSTVTNMAPLLDTRLSTSYTSRVALDSHLRHFNLNSELHAMVTFSQGDTEAVERVVSSPAVKYFGTVVEDKSCTVLPARNCRSLYLRGLPHGLRHSAVGVILGDVLAPLGFIVPPPREEDGVMIRGGTLGWGGGYSDPSLASACPVTNRDGEAVLTFETFEDALCAHDALVGLLLEAKREGKSVGGSYSIPSSVTVGFASFSDLKRCGIRSGSSLWVESREEEGGEGSHPL